MASRIVVESIAVQNIEKGGREIKRRRECSTQQSARSLAGRTSIVMRMETAAINASLEAMIGFDKPSLTSRIVSPLWCNPSMTKGFVHRLLGSKNTPEKIDLFVAPEQIAACSGAGSFCTREAQWACNRT
jgi:hypothetical protein